MARQRSGFNRGNARSRRRTGWEEGPGSSSVAAAFSASGSAILGAGLVALADGLTVARIRGNMELVLNSATAALSGYHGAVGIGKTTSEAFTVGITALPTPLTDADWDGWMWHSFYDLHAVTGAASDGVNAVSNYLRIPVDSKAMRKFDLSDTLFVVTEVIEVGVATMSIHFDSRILLFLP